MENLGWKGESPRDRFLLIANLVKREREKRWGGLGTTLRVITIAERKRRDSLFCTGSETKRGMLF